MDFDNNIAFDECFLGVVRIHSCHLSFYNNLPHILELKSLVWYHQVQLQSVVIDVPLKDNFELRLKTIFD